MSMGDLSCFLQFAVMWFPERLCCECSVVLPRRSDNIAAPYLSSKQKGHNTLLKWGKANKHTTSGLCKSTQVRLVISVGIKTVLAPVYVQPGLTRTQADSSLDQNE
jgi:hypothetical protein